MNPRLIEISILSTCETYLFAYVSNPIQCNDVNFNIRTNHRPQKVRRQYLALINRAGGLYGRILTEVVSTDRTQ